MNLVIAEWNANGILNHINETEIFLKENYIDILLISETHLTNKSFLKINGYEVVATNHPDNKAHGGAAVLIKSNIKFEVAEPVAETNLQAAGVKVFTDRHPLYIYSIYFPPRFNVKCDEFEDFFKKLGNKFIVGGDFNAKHPWWGSRIHNPKGKELYKCVLKNHYNVLSTGTPSYWPSDPYKQPDLLDFFIYKGISPLLLDVVHSDDLSSDHSPIIVYYRTTLIGKTPINKLFT